MSQTDQDQATAAHGKIIARAWRDPAFKAKLLADPHATLKEAGLQVREGVTVTVVENTDTHHHLVLPPKPTGELSDAELDKVAGGIVINKVADVTITSVISLGRGAHPFVVHQGLAKVFNPEPVY